MSDKNHTYQVLARKWRPKKFSELVGQNHIVRTLTNSINYNRIAHAYLFVGPRGTGKTTTARLFASAINAKNAPTVDFDPNDDISLAIANSSCMDVIEIDGASNNSVEQTRDIREECQYMPTSCRYKIYIIDEVHMLTNAAFNALLKVLEEPPKHVKFIFATTEAYKVLPTIVSRCQRLSFRPVDTEILVKKLSEISESEGIKISDDALQCIAKLANGGVRDAESILDRMISYCDKEITANDVNSAYGLADQKTIESIISSMYYGDYKKLLDISKSIAESNCDRYRLMCDIECLIHEQLLKIVNTDSNYPDRMIRILETIHDSKESVRSGISEGINFETAILKAAEHGQSRAIDAILRDIREIRSNGTCQTDEDDKEGENYLEKSRLSPDIQSILTNEFRAKLNTL